MVEIRGVIDAIEGLIAAGPPASTTLLRAQTRIGRIEIGEGIAGSALVAALRTLEARRAIIVTEPVAWGIAGPLIEPALAQAGLPVHTVLLPRGEAAKRLSVVERGARELAALRVERGEPIVAVGGGALGDTAGFLAATYLRGVPIVHVPTTLVAQIDSSIGGKTGVDLPDGKNLVGAFHQPAEIIIDIAFLASLPVRQRRAALGEAAKMAVLGDERLFALLETAGEAIAIGTPEAFGSGAVAEVVERCAWAKMEIVVQDEHEQAGRIALNLGHSIGHALEAAAAFRGLLHGEAVAYGLRGATRIGLALGVTPPDRAERIERLLTGLGLGIGGLPYSLSAVREPLATDKKRARGQLRWVLPTDAGVTVRSDVPDELVDEVLAELLGAGPVTLELDEEAEVEVP